MWFLVLIFGFLGSTIQLSRFLSSYFQYPVIVNIRVEHVPHMEFPAVTICNLNRVNVSGDCDIKIVIGGGINGYVSKPLLISERRSALSCKNMRDGKYKNDSFVNFLDSYYKMSEKERYALGHKFEDITQNCTFCGRVCQQEEFVFFQNLRYGNQQQSRQHHSFGHRTGIWTADYHSTEIPRICL